MCESVDERIIKDVLAERRYQDDLWGVQQHNEADYFAILSEEVGEAAEQVVEARFDRDNDRRMESLRKLRKELIQVAAVAVAFVGRIDQMTAEDNDA